MNEITWTCKHFNDLTNKELYEILRLRNEVFIIEQNCPYQDLDRKDLKAFHVMGHLTPTLSTREGDLIAHTRLLPQNVSYAETSIGRVVTSPKARGTGIGKILMENSIKFLKKEFGNVPIRIGAQKYLQKFYEGFDFVREGDEYLEDGIPHVIMLRVPR